MKIKWEWIAPFFPALLSVIIVTVLDAAGLIDFNFSIHDVDTFIILGGLILTIVTSSILLSREAVKQMRLTSLRQAQQAYEAERSRFLRRLDHELKNPLMGIRLAMNNMADADDWNTRQQLKTDIHTAITRLNKLVTDLRKISDLSSQNMEVSAVNPKKLLEEIYTQACEEPAANERNLQLNLPESPQSLTDIMGDPDLLLVAIYNLLDNALKYTHAGDTIALRAFTEGEMVAIEVRDTGIGIAANDLPYIWDELYRSGQVRQTPGNGIGLTLVKLIIERHGGKIEVQSQINEGTTIRVYLPAISPSVPVTGLMQPVSNL
jgi:signal transduction histidine kinase